MVKITHISDTHGVHEKLTLYGGDILIHSGDVFDFNNQIDELKIIDWFDKLPYQYKILVQGNHDNFRSKELPQNFFILKNDVLKLHEIKIYGVSAVLSEVKSRRQYNVSTESEIMQDLNADEFDILVTHGSPKGILDKKFNRSIGSQSLLNFVKLKQPKYHLFGHSHHSKGHYFDGVTNYINNSIIQYLKDLNIQSNPLDIWLK
jgi:Icc-related predicted phosphoesterase